jgi:hypothetical protein
MFKRRLDFIKGVMKRSALTVFVALALLASTGGGDAIGAKQMATSRYQFSVVSWETTHFMDKWWRQMVNLVPGSSASPQERQQAIEEYFGQAQDARVLRGEVEEVIALLLEERPRLVEDVQAELDRVQERQKRLQAVVEEALEAEIDSVLGEMGISGKLGPFRWPPVDFTFEQSPLLLVTSPRDAVRRLDDVLLRSALELPVQEGLEAEVENADDVAALVVHIGGVATYPAHVSPTATLHGALVLASHEWLHHYLFFRPLGLRWFAGGDITSINETVANIAGEEIGDRVLTRLTGRVVVRLRYRPPALRPPEEPGVFDFSREMRKTRLRLDELLADGLVAESESYLEQRRQLFVANGFSIRKLNTAYFAFYGTYADGPASVSPIDAQLRAIRAGSRGVAEFLGKVSRITSARELEEMALAAGWRPTPK